MLDQELKIEPKLQIRGVLSQMLRSTFHLRVRGEERSRIHPCHNGR